MGKAARATNSKSSCSHYALVTHTYLYSPARLSITKSTYGVLHGNTRVYVNSIGKKEISHFREEETIGAS